MKKAILLLIMCFVSIQASAQTEFITTWITNGVGSSGSTSIRIPTTGGGYNYDVDWKSDGNWETGFTGDAEHDYMVAGTYTVSIRGSFPRIYFNNAGDKTKIVSIDQWGTIAWSSMNRAFAGCLDLFINATDIPDLSNVRDMTEMFRDAQDINQDIGNWNVSSVTNMRGMFRDAFRFNQDISNWNVSNVTDLSYMFYGATDFNQDIGDWNVGNVTNMDSMFAYNYSFNGDISNWNVGNVTNMQFMFRRNSAFNQDISNWNVGNVTNMQYMFSNASVFNQDISNWNVGNVTNMHLMFRRASAFNADIGDWNVANVTIMQAMFSFASAFNGDIGNWDVRNVTDMALMFGSASAFNQDLGNWDVSNVTDMYAMFGFASAFNQDLGNWDVSNVTDMALMFDGVTLSKANYDALLNGWSSLTLQNGVTFSGGNSQYCNGQAARDTMINTYGWTITDGGQGCLATDYFITTWKTDPPSAPASTTITIPTTGGGYNYDVDWENDGIFDDLGVTGNITHDYLVAGTYTVAIRGSFPQIFFNNSGDKDKILSIEQWGTNIWSSMHKAFAGCSNLQGNALDTPNLTNVTDMSYMFFGATAFNQDIGNWNVGGVNNMEGMFGGAVAFNHDISGWNVGSVTNMEAMFNNADAFNQNIVNWNVGMVENMTAMFANTATFNQDIGNWNVGSVTDMSLMFANTAAFNGTIGNWNVGMVNNMTAMFFDATAFNRSLNNWNVENVTNMNAMFTQATVFNGDISNWNVGMVGDMSQMFQGASAFNGNIGNWNVSMVNNMDLMFTNATAFNQNIGNWNVGSVTSMSSMFSNASAFNQYIGNWNVVNVENMTAMFSSASAFNQNLNLWNVGKVLSMSSMFTNASAFNQDIGNWNIAMVTGMFNMFDGVALSTANYDAILIGWGTDSSGTAGDMIDDIPNGIAFGGGSNVYCTGQAQRQELIDTYSWTITDGGQFCPTDAFVTTWKTDNPGTSNNTSIIIPTTGGGYNYDVDWNNNGNWETGFTGNATHDYGTAGTYTVGIRGSFPQIYFNNSGDKDKILSIDQWGTIAWSSMNNAFNGCSNLIENTTTAPDLSNVFDISFMFANASSLNQLLDWDLSNVTNMESMFQSATAFNQYIGLWDVSNVINMKSMFQSAWAFNQDLRDWDVSNVTSMSSMFSTALAFNNNIVNWDVSKVSDMSSLFFNATSFNQDISNWNVGRVTNMSQMFFSATSFNLDIGSWDLSSVTNMTSMFDGVTLSTANYDATLIGWATDSSGTPGDTIDDIPSGITFSGGNSQYCNGQFARENLTTSFGWTLTDAGQGCLPTDHFITTWKTDNPGTSNPTSITIPTTGGGYSYDVDWNNDGTFDDFGVTGNITHDYGAPGTYTVAMRGSFPQIYFSGGGDAQKILAINQWGTNIWSSMNNAFNGCSNLVENATDAPDLANVTDLFGMFWGASSLNNDISNWDVSKVENMGGMFREATAFNQDIGNWNVSNVEFMGGMFSNATAFNQDIGGWDVGEVNNMTQMFIYASAFNQDISNWDVSNVTGMEYMFSNATAFNQDIGNWNVSSVENMTGMFSYATAFNQDIGNWNVSSVNRMYGVFWGASIFNQDIGDWNVSSVENMSFMFADATEFNQDLGNWNVSSVTNMSWMFQDAIIFNQDLGNWDVGKVTDMTNMFDGVTLSTENYDATLIGWATDSSGIAGDMIDDIPSNVAFNGGNSQFCVSQVSRQELIDTFSWSITDGGQLCLVANAFITTWKTDNLAPGSSNSTSITIPTTGGGYLYNVDWDNDGTYDDFGLTGDFTHDYGAAGTYTVVIQGAFPQIYFNGGADRNKILSVDQWGTNNWTSMAYAFFGCSNLSGNAATDTPDLSDVTSMSNMFANALVFNQDISNWNVENVTNMESLFANASNFNQDIGNWNVSGVDNMQSMFQSAAAFNQDIGNWDVGSAGNMRAMLAAATAFNQDISNWNVGKVNDMAAMFTGATAFNQDLGNWDLGMVTDMTNMFLNVTLSTANYDAILTGWATDSSGTSGDAIDDIPNGITFSGGNSQYCVSQAERQNLIDNFTWSITDAGQFCSTDTFITTWKTDNPGGPSNAITIPTAPGITYNYEVDWENNGIWETFTGDATHVYGAPGTYTIAIRGSFPQIYFNNGGDKEKILSIEQWGTNIWSSMTEAFYGCSNLVGNALDTPNLSNVTDMSLMFARATVFNQNIDIWNVANVTNMNAMFFEARAFNGAIGNWNVSSVTDMSFMFTNAHAFNQNIGNWNVGNVTNTHAMFASTPAFNGDIGNWNVGKVTNMNAMFRFASGFNQNIGFWNVGMVTNMTDMFNGASAFNGNIGNWNVGKVTDMHGMFEEATAFNQYIGNWNVENVTGMEWMFNRATAFNQNIGNWNVSSVTNMLKMFDSASAFNQDIGNWNVENVTDMEFMFYDATAFNQDISNWNVSNVTYLHQMFAGANSFNQDIGNWNVENVTNMRGMFNEATAFNQDISNWNVGNVENMSIMFDGASAFNQDIGSWDIGKVTDMTAMFNDVSLSTANYDATLIGWATDSSGTAGDMIDDIPSNITFSGGNSQYCASQAERQDLINNFTWAISDGGPAAGCGPSGYFITTWKTDNPGGPGNSITIPTAVGVVYNYEVDWENNGIWETFTGDATHVYGAPGTYTVAIRGTFPQIFFNFSGDKDKILSIEQWGTIAWTSMSRAFAGCSNLQGNATDTPDLSNLVDLGFMFSGASSFNQDIGNWDVGSVGSMNSMFSQATAFNQDIGSWNVSNVTSMSTMFNQATAFNQNIGNWNVGNVNSMSQMFRKAATFNQDIGSWNVRSVTDMNYMFKGATAFNQNIDSWNVSIVTTMYEMFRDTNAFNQDIGSWNVSNVENMVQMFWNATAFNQDIGNWNVGNVEYLINMFNGATAFNQDIGNWDVSNVTTMYGMFSDAVAFNQDISNWDVSGVTRMGYMFESTPFNQDIGSWDVSSVTSMANMFEGATAFDQDIGNWNVGMVTDMTAMFDGVTLSTANYDALLNGWNSLTLQNGVTFSGGNSQYCNGQTARENMINTFGWTITDGGLSSPPVAVCMDITVQLDATGSFTITANDIDNGSSFGCTGSATLSVSPSTFDCSNIGPNTVTLTVTDINGNIATCTSIVTVEDNEAPVITCIGNGTRDTNTGICNYTVVGTEFDATFTDNCMSGSISNDLNATATIAGETLPIGITTVVWTVIDGNGQMDTCTTIITVEDNEDPVIACPLDITVNSDLGFCGAVVNFGDAIANDNCGVMSVVQSGGLMSGSLFPIGINTVEYTATDVNGNTNVCTFTITVADNEPAVAVCQDITIQLDATGNATITATDINGGSTDNCGIASMVASQTDFNCTNVGANNITLTVTDDNGNVSTCTAVVTVEDVTMPDVFCMDITVQLDATGMVTISGTDIDNGSTDTCGIASYDLDIDTFDCSNVGANNVTLTVTDINGNAASCMAVVTVEDNTLPTLVCMDITLELGADGTAMITATDVSSSIDDNCGIFSTGVDITNFDCSDIGTPVTVSVFALDNNGNVTSCNAVVTIVDLLAPVLTCPADQTVDPGPGALFYEVPDYFATGEATAIDNCTDPVVITTQSPVAGTLLADGVHIITLTAEDEYSNLATCTFELTVESTLGVNENELSLGSITVYPNPTKNILYIESSKTVLTGVSIFDIRGRKVSEVNINNQSNYPIDLSNLENAAYFVNIKTENGTVTKRIIKY